MLIKQADITRGRYKILAHNPKFANFRFKKYGLG